MFQSKHQKNFREYTFVNKARNRQPVRPVINGEPGYENIPNLLNKWNFQRLDAADVRLSAYWSMLSGAAGYTYGCNEVWQMNTAESTPLFGAHLSWQEALDLPGARKLTLATNACYQANIRWNKLAIQSSKIGTEYLRPKLLIDLPIYRQQNKTENKKRNFKQ